VARYRRPLLRYCAGMLPEPRAEDVLQQALLNAHLAMPSLGDNPNVRAWLYRISHNVAVNVLRAGRTHAALDERAAASKDDPPEREETDAGAG
jgi:RNA polymerase sigma-70 factor (ECF subfamily)